LAQLVEPAPDQAQARSSEYGCHRAPTFLILRSERSERLEGRTQAALHASPRRKHLRIIRKRLKLQRVAAWIAHEHRLLLARLSGEAQIGLDDEIGLGRLKALGQRIEILILQDQPEMADRNLFAVDRAGRSRVAQLRGQVGDDLVSQQVKIDPVIALPPRAAAQHARVKIARRLQIMDRKSEVKAGAGAHGGLQISSLGFARRGASA